MSTRRRIQFVEDVMRNVNLKPLKPKRNLNQLSLVVCAFVRVCAQAYIL